MNAIPTRQADYAELVRFWDAMFRHADDGRLS